MTGHRGLVPGSRVSERLSRKEVWVSPSVLFALAQVDRTVVRTIVSFLGPRLALLPDIDDRIVSLQRSGDAAKRKAADDVNSAIATVPRRDEIVPTSNAEMALRAHRILMEDWTDLPIEVRTECADLWIAAKWRPSSVVLAQPGLLGAVLPEMLGVHHLLSEIARIAPTLSSAQVWKIQDDLLSRKLLRFFCDGWSYSTQVKLAATAFVDDGAMRIEF